jgi:hypothetical protein
MLVAASLVLMVFAPGSAVAGESDDSPLSKVPEQYQPMVDVAAEELGVSSEDLESASPGDLRSLVCAELESRSTSQLVADVQAALEASPPKEYQDLSEAEREQLEQQLPTLIGQIEGEYCETSAAGSSDDSDADDGSDAGDDRDGEIPVPTRVDTGGGGAAAAGGAPVLFGVLFAALFGLFGVGVTARRRDA